MPALAIIDRTVTQVAARLADKDLKVLADVDAGLVRSDHDAPGSAIRSHRPDRIAQVSVVVRTLETSGLVERVGTDWRLTPAGTLILKRHAGGTR
jgi:ribosomal protein S19E (S16A)